MAVAVAAQVARMVRTAKTDQMVPVTAMEIATGKAEALAAAVEMDASQAVAMAVMVMGQSVPALVARPEVRLYVPRSARRWTLKRLPTSTRRQMSATNHSRAVQMSSMTVRV
jgi:hypothetical protein